MPPDLHIQLLGEFRVADAGEVVSEMDPPRLQALLAYLILHRAARQPRHRIAFAFWPDSEEGQARTNLRQLLHHLRKALPYADLCLHVDRRSLRWAPDAPARVDVIEFEEAWADANRAAEVGQWTSALESARRAAKLYQGDLLPACYDPWIEPERRRLRHEAVSGLGRWTEWLERRRAYGEAARTAERLLELDPACEEALRAAIRLHALAGDPARATRAYREGTRRLAEKVGVEPSPETKRVYRSIRRGELERLERWSPRAMDADSWDLVGRHREWERLRSIWGAARRGAPRLTVVTGEAGIGKTRLAEAFADWAARQGVLTARARCWAAEGVLPFSPVVQWLAVDRLRTAAAGLDEVWTTEIARLAPELVGHRATDAGDGPESWRRLRLFEALARAVLAPAEPLLLLLDDLQWCDGETLEWLHYLLRFDRRARLLVLTTVRSGELGTDGRFASRMLQLRQVPGFEEIELGPLEVGETADLGAAVAGRDLDEEEAAWLHRQAEGNPLFVVEMLRSSATGRLIRPVGEEAGAGESALPARVRRVIQSRLAQLSPDARDLVPLLATIGRDFGLEVLRRASPAPDHRLARALEELLSRHLLREQADGRLAFSHDKIREVAYADTAGPRRAILHDRVASALVEAHAAASESVAGEIARHLERAGHPGEAIPWRRRAARRALAVHAFSEAAEHLERALTLLETALPADDRTSLELELQIELGVPLVALEHYSGRQVWEVYRRARDLCDRMGRPGSPPVLRALALASLMRSRLPEVVELGRQLMTAAERDRDPMLSVEAHYVLGVALYWQGRIRPARNHLARALTVYRPDRAREHLRLFAQDPSVICGVRLALTEWQLGDREGGHRRCLDVLSRARKLGHPFSLAYARCFGTWVLIECGDVVRARRETAAVLRESREHGVAVWPAWAGIAEGYLLVEAGNPTLGLDRMRAAAADYAAEEVDLGFPYHQALLARACARAGQVDEGIRAVEAGLRMAERTGERFWDPELHRLRGDLLRRLGASGSEVESAYRTALRVAREQGARSLEARVHAARSGAIASG